MICKTLILLGLAVCVLGDLHATSEQKVIVRHKKISHDEHDKNESHDKYEWTYPSYEFAYKVDDPHTGDKKGHEETREGDEVKGEYWLMQPDGRKRIVKYYADKKSGFKADVQYIGEAEQEKDYKKSHHIPHYPKVEHKSVKVEYKKKDDKVEDKKEDDKAEYKVEDNEQEDMKKYYYDDKEGYPSEQLPIDIYPRYYNQRGY